MPAPPIGFPKPLVLNGRTGVLYGAALGFLAGLVWQAIAMYENPLSLWRTCVVTGAVVGGVTGFVAWRVVARRRASRDATSETTQSLAGKSSDS